MRVDRRPELVGQIHGAVDPRRDAGATMGRKGRRERHGNGTVWAHADWRSVCSMPFNNTGTIAPRKMRMLPLTKIAERTPNR